MVTADLSQPNEAKTTSCRDCGRSVSFTAFICPSCGAPKPQHAEFTGWGYEWKSKQTLLGLPLVHISFKYRTNRTPVVATGWLAIGQFSCGLVNVSQFGFGPLCLSQFALAWAAVAQFTAAEYAVCQFGLVKAGMGQALCLWRELF